MSLNPGHVLFGVNSEGRVLYLHSTVGSENPNGPYYNTSRWLELPYLGVDFKRVCAVAPSVGGRQDTMTSSGSPCPPSSGSSGGRLWALGGDHQVYVFVFGVEVPIRVKEYTYENHRWNPMDGFGPHLLPTDRPRFSSADGTQRKEKSDIKLPTMAWRWQTDWYVETNFAGKDLEKEGWTYAIDFPAEYSAKKGFTSCVRRRKWVRYRKYVATDSWSAVPSLFKDINREPFMDISVGGHEIPNGDPDELQVWAVTILGNVYIRQGVTATCPEGTGWLHIETPGSCEVGQISVSPSGLVWAVTLNGNALVRLGVSRMEPRGTKWQILDSPNPRSHLSFVCTGENAVWALSRDRRVWFRNGVRAAAAGDNNALATGSKWIEMVGEMIMLTIGPGDQVFGITESDHSVVFRTGVVHSDLSGKTWKPLTAQSLRLRTASDSSTASGPVCLEKDQPSSHLSSSPANTTSLEFQASSTGSAPSAPRAPDPRASGRSSSTTEFVHAGSSNARFKNTNYKELGSKPQAGDSSSNQAQEVSQSMYESAKENLDHVKDTLDSTSTSSGNVLDHEEHYMDDDPAAMMLQPAGPQWVWLSAGACSIDPMAGPPGGWFIEALGSQQSLSGEPWRVDILQRLKIQNERCGGSNPTFSAYESAIERTSWMRKASSLVHSGEHRTKFEQCSVELELTGSPGQGGGIDFGTLSVFGSTKKSKEHLSLYEITSVYQMGDKTLAVQTSARCQKLQPLLIKFNTDLEMEEWQADLVNGMNSIRGITTAPTFPGCLFSVTARGEVMVFDPKVALDNAEQGSTNSYSPVKKLDGQFSLDLNVDGEDSSGNLMRVLENGFGPGTMLSVTLMVKENCQRFSVNLQTGQVGLDADAAFHFNPRLDVNQTVLNSKTNGEWLVEEKQALVLVQEDGTANKAFIPGKNAQLVIKSEQNYYEVAINGNPYCRFNHRVRPENVTHLRISGEVQTKSAVYNSKTFIIPPSQMYWRCLGGGHFLQVETCSNGVTWALGYDNRPWVYTGGWGGAHFKGVATSKFGINPVEDSKYFYIYENQRWNPLTGFTMHGLPTDRHCWSDRTGQVAMSKDTVKLPSMRWQWTSDWLIDYTTPGGVDAEGWQYATDFPSSYHGKIGFTDYVRRRRWARKCKIVTDGPWRAVGSTKLIDVSMQVHPKSERVDTWAIASNGECLWRRGVRAGCPEGEGWEVVPADARFQSVSVGFDGRVWVVAKDGSAYLRHGVTDASPIGQLWLHVSQPAGGNDSALRSISVGGDSLVWAVDTVGRLYLRQEVTPVFPEGTSWLQVATGVRTISACHKELWCVLEHASPSLFGLIPAALQQAAAGAAAAATGGILASGPSATARGILAKRSGITPDSPAGIGWDVAIGGGWKDISIRGKVDRP